MSNDVPLSSSLYSKRSRLVIVRFGLGIPGYGTPDGFTDAIPDAIPGAIPSKYNCLPEGAVLDIAEHEPRISVTSRKR